MNRFDLVTIDLDGTLLPDTTAFEVVLRAAGRGADVEASDARFFAGEISLEDCFWEQWQWVQELRLSDLHRALRGAPWLPEIGAGVALLREHVAHVCLLTDQPSTVTDFLARWNLVDALASPVLVREGRQMEIDARFDKWANLQRRLQAAGVTPERVCHVGNGVNDVPVWQHVGGAVAVFAPPDVAQAADMDVGRPDSFVQVADAVLRLDDQRGG